MNEFAATCSVRAATGADLPLLRRFKQALVAAERPFDPTLKSGELHYYDLEALLTSPDTCLLVAVAAGRVIGSGYARLVAAEPFLQHTHYAHLGFMYVEPEYRGRGINARLLEALRQWAAAQGVSELRLKVYAQNTAARQAYEKFGFSPHLLEMRWEG
jgi:GNAT superfamily N-acetyltransferase